MVPEDEIPCAGQLLTHAVVRYFWDAVDQSISTLESMPELSGLRQGDRNERS